MPERVWADGLVDPGPPSEAAHDPPGGVPVETLARLAEEDRALDPLTDGQVDRTGSPGRERGRDDLAALAEHRERAVPALETEGFDVGAERFGNPQAIDGQKGDERVLAC